MPKWGEIELRKCAATGCEELVKSRFRSYFWSPIYCPKHIRSKCWDFTGGENTHYQKRYAE